MEIESLNWFRFSKCLVTVGTEVLHELLKFNIQTYSFSEYHKLWLEKVNFHGRSDSVTVLWKSLKQHHRTLDASCQLNLQSLLSKWKRSRGPKDMDIRQQLSVLQHWEDDIQDFLSKHATQHDTLKKWSSELQSLAALNTSLLMSVKTWTQGFVNLCQADQLDLVHLTEQHHERTKHLSEDFLNKLEFCIRQGPGELHTILNIFQQDKVNSERDLKSELHNFFTSWQPKIDELLDIWITQISGSSHQQVLQSLVTDVKNSLPRVYQTCQAGLQNICSTWHNNLQKNLADWNNQLQQVSASTSDLQGLAKSWHTDLQAFPSASDQQIRDFFDSKRPDVQNLRTKRIITGPQWSYLYPTHGYIDLRKFDITLLYTLHRNVFPIWPPELGWSGEILETDHSTGADLMRLKKFRNDYIGHIPDPTLTNSEFEKLWMILEESLNRLLKGLGQEFQEKVKQRAAELKTCPFDFREEIKLQLSLINWFQGDILDILDLQRSTDDKIEKFPSLVHMLDEKVQKLYQQQAINISEMQDFKTQIDHMMKGVKKKMASNATNVSKRMSRMETSVHRVEKLIIEGVKRLETRVTDIETILSKKGECKNCCRSIFKAFKELSSVTYVAFRYDFHDISILHQRVADPKVNKAKLNNRIDMTRGRIERHKSNNTDVHVRTRAFDHARHILLEHKHLVLQGKPGDGKTYLALSLVADLVEDKEIQPIQIYNTNEWEEMVDKKQPLVVFLDDVLGKYEVSETELDQWKKFSELIHPNLSCSSIFLIICIRTQIVSAIKLSLHRNDAFSLLFNSNVVDISNEKHSLTREERRQMLMKYDPNCMDRNDKFTIENILEMKSIIGFPQNCKIYRCRQNVTTDLKDVFTSNVFLFEEILEISKRSPEIYAFLVLLMLSDGSLCLEKKLEEVKNKLKAISDCLQLKKKLNNAEVKGISQLLCGTLVEYNKEDKKFNFQHDCIETAVFYSFGKDYPDVTLRHCSLKQLAKMCCVANERDQFDGEDFLDFKIMIGDDQFTVMCERFDKGLESGERESFKFISEALVWKDLRFVQYFSNKMTSANDMLNFLSKRDPDA